MKSCIGLYYQLIVKDKNGKVVRKTRLRRSKSFVLQFMSVLEIQTFQANRIQKATDGSSNSSAPNALNFACNGGVGIETHGTMVGTGTTTPASDDYVLETPIAHGVGAGQLSYGAQSKTITAMVPPNIDYILTRTFNNGSGGTINVTEAGIYSKVTTYFIMIVHDVFTAVPVLNAQTLTVNYTFRTTV